MDDLNFSPYLRLIQKTGTTRHPGGLKATDMLLKRTNLTKNSRLLDVGCGAGHTSAYIAKNYHCLVTGVDISSDALARVNSFYQNEPYFDRMSFEVADASNLPYSDGYFDVVLCESVLLFIADVDAALTEMARVVKPGGFLALNEVCISDKKGLKRVKNYFAEPEFGGFLTTVNDLTKLFRRHWTVILEDEQPLDLKSQMRSEIKHWVSPRGILQLLEIAHLALAQKEARHDLFSLGKFLLNMPKGALDELRALMFLAKKTRL